MTVRHEPYLQLGNAALGASTDQIEVIWQTTGSVDSGESFRVEYAPSGTGNWSTINWASVQTINTGVAYPSGTPATPDDQRRNRYVTITGLPWNSTYDYKVIHHPASGPEVEYSGEFTTRLQAGSTTAYSFGAYGDSANYQDPSGDPNQYFRDVIALIDNSPAAFNVLLGDNAYNIGIHSDLDQRLDPASGKAEQVVADFIRNRIEYYGFGNHEVDQNNGTGGQASRDNYSSPLNGPTDTAATGSYFADRPEHNFSFDHGGVHYVTFDTNPCQDNHECDGWENGGNDSAPFDRALEWLTDDLSATDAQWKVVFVHQPVATKSGHDELTPESPYYRKVVTLLNKYGVDLLLVGHSHNYQRSFPLTTTGWVNDNDNSYAEGAGVVQALVGTGGRNVSGSFPGNNSAQEWVAAFDWTRHGFLQVDVSTSSLTGNFVPLQNPGTAGDSFAINAATDSTGPRAEFILEGSNSDLDPALDSLLVNSNQDNVQIRLYDGFGAGIRDASVMSSTAILKRDGAVVHPSQYDFLYDSATNRITIQLDDGADFTNGTYEIILSSGAAKIRDNVGATGNAMNSTTLRFEVDTYIQVVTTTFNSNILDTWIGKEAPTTTHGTATEIQADGHTAGAGTNPSQALIRFNSIFGGGAIPLGVRILGATLNLNVSDAGSGFSVHQMFVTWDANATWNVLTDGVQTNDVEAETTPDDSRGDNDDRAHVLGGPSQFNVRTTLQNWSNGATNHGWAIVPIGSLATNGTRFTSVDAASNRPTLTVRYIASESIVSSFSSGCLNVVGTDAGETITVAYDGANKVTVNGAFVNNGGSDLLASAVSCISVVGRDGNDIINLSGVSSSGANGYTHANLSTHITVLGGNGTDSITGSAFADLLVGHDGNDTIRGGNGNDTIDGTGGLDSLFGDADADAITGSDANDTARGGTGNDTILGGFGNDSLYGEDNDDWIYGDLELVMLDALDGNDQVYGGEGHDRIQGDSYGSLWSESTGDDTLRGEGGNDSIYGDAYANSGPLPGDENDGDDFIYGGAGNDLIFGDGQSGGAAAYFSSGNDTIYGEAGLDVIHGDGGNTGGYGHDFVDAGLDNDNVSGGGGNDYLIGSGGNDVIGGNDGNDSIFGDSPSYSGIPDGDDVLMGDAGNDWVMGDAGFNWQAAGDDLLYGGPDNDTLGGDGIGEGYNGYGEGSDQILGEAGADLIYGDTGFGWTDPAYGCTGYGWGTFGGNDTLHGGTENDTVYGDGHSALYFASYGYGYGGYGYGCGYGYGRHAGSPGWDYAYDGDDLVFADEGADTVYGDRGAGNGFGGSGDDSIRGSIGNDYLHGEDGSDTYFFGGTADLGTDTIAETGTAYTDTIDFQTDNFGQAATLNLSTTGNQTVATGKLVLNLVSGTSIENVKGSNHADSVTGNSQNNYLWGFDGNDTLRGGTGTDTLEGGANDDALHGEGGGDIFRFSGSTNLGSDTITEADHADTDTLDFALFSQAAIVDLSANNVAQPVATSKLTLTLASASGDAIENIIGSAFNDSFTGNGRNNSILGNAGNDTLYGLSGSDTLRGGAGDDDLHGGFGSDSMAGDGDNDEFWAQDNTIDTIDGGTGTDTVQSSDGSDVITNVP